MDENDLRELEELKRLAEAEQAHINAVMDEVQTELNRIALKHFPRLGTLEGEDIRRYAELLSRTSCNFAIHLEDLAGKTW